MKNKFSFKFIWKHNRGWFLTTSIVLALFLAITVVSTQFLLIKQTISTVMGGERRVLVSGDASKYTYYTADNEDFIYYQTDSDFSSKNETLKEAKKLNEKIAEEGMVLLKNDNDALPIATEKSTVNKASKAPKISVFGKNSVNLVYGGSGSAGGSGKGMVGLYDSLTDAGYSVNETLKKFYESSASGSGREGNPAMGSGTLYGFATGETPQSKYTEEVTASYKDYNDAAIVVFSRIGGESYDLPRTMATNSSYSTPVKGAGSVDDHYLELDKNEKALLRHVTKNFNKVILLLNCGTSFELDFLRTDEYGKIDAAIWMGLPGSTGANAVGRILNGNVNPSGRTVDTFAADFTQDPSWYNFGNNRSVGGNRYTTAGNGSKAYFVDYEESIYVGYRYYETRGYVQNYEYDDSAWYDSAVVYPFGYGLSYTKFQWEIVEHSNNTVNLEKDGTIEVKVKVKNVGDVAGMDVVQLYYTAPYYDEIEKAHVVLGDFCKTGVIKPNGEEVVTLSLKVEDMASYDYSDANKNGFKGYELDDGIYHIRLGRNAHDAWAGENAENFDISYNVPQTLDDEYRVFGYTYEMDIDGTEDGNDNKFEEVSAHIQNCLMTRSDFESTMPTTPTDEDRAVSGDFIESLKFTAKDEENPWYVASLPEKKTYEKNYKLYDLISYNKETGEVTIDYDDERWDNLLDQLTVEEMAYLIGTGNFNTAALEKIDKPKTTDPDSPVGFTNFMGDPTVYDTCQYTGVSLMGATWNEKLMHDMGVMVGNEGIWGNVRGDGRPYSGWYAPAVNIHRSPFGGRNWEYYSEDPLLSGRLGANTVLGAKEKGVYAYVKHFAVNEQETDRDSYGLVCWLSEQSLRELYLKPFQIIVEEGKTTAMMSSFTRIGTVWAGGSYQLLTEVLRKEWGFKGMVITDYAKGYDQYMDENQMIRTGGDLVLFQDQLPDVSDKSATQVASIRRATKNILYTVAGSNAMNGMGEGVVYKYVMPLWTVLLIVLDVVLVLGFAVWGFFSIRKSLNTVAEN